MQTCAVKQFIVVFYNTLRLYSPVINSESRFILTMMNYLQYKDRGVVKVNIFWAEILVWKVNVYLKYILHECKLEKQLTYNIFKIKWLHLSTESSYSADISMLQLTDRTLI